MRAKRVAVILSLMLMLTLGLVACTTKSADTTYDWSGLNDVTIYEGDNFDLMQGISVKTNQDVDVTNKVSVLTLVDNEQELNDIVGDDYYDFDKNVSDTYIIYYKLVDGDYSDIKERKVSVTKGHNIAYGDFSKSNKNEFTNWTLDAPGGTATVTAVNNKPQIDIKDSGNGWWSLQYITKVNVKQNEVYKISITAKSETGKSVAFGFEDAQNNYSMVKGITAHKLSADMKTYESYFSPTSDYIGIKAVLYFGRMLETDRVSSADENGYHQINLESVYIEKVDVCPEVTFDGLDNITYNSGSLSTVDLLAGVSAKNGDTDLTDKIKIIGELTNNVTESTSFDVHYIIENSNGPMALATRRVRVNVYNPVPYNVLNGNFAQEYDYWTKDVNAQNPGEANYNISSQGAEITILNPSTAGWHIQLHQNVNFELKNYIIKVTAKSTVNRSVVMEVKGTTQNTFDLTTEFKDFTMNYVSKSTGSTKIAFLLGGGGVENKDSKIIIKSIEVVLDTDQTRSEVYELADPTFVQGLKYWDVNGDNNGGKTTYVVNSDNSITVKFADNSNENWRTQFRQDGLSFEKDATYKVTLKAKATTARNIDLEVRNLKEERNLAESPFALTTEATVFTKTFTLDKNESDIRVALLLGGENTKDNDITIYEFKIEKVS